MYNVYVSNFNTARDTVRRISEEKNGRFTQFIQERGSTTAQFIEMLSTPIYHLSKLSISVEVCSLYLKRRKIHDMQRIPSLCVSGSKDEQHWNMAFSMLHETANFVIEQLQLSEEKLVVANIQRRLTGYDKPLNMEQEATRFLLETTFMCNGHKRVFFLFNDSIIIGKAHRGNQIKVKEKTELQVVFYEPVKGDPTAFILKTPLGVNNITGKAEDIQNWMKQLEANLPSRKRNPTFERPIKEILAREDRVGGVPSIVTQCIETILKQDGLKTEGLFRISGERTEISALKELFDNCM